MNLLSGAFRYQYQNIDDAFYKELDKNVIKNVKSRDNLVIAGDFNSETGTNAVESNIYRKQIGIYGKERANSNGYSLFNLAKSHFFKYKKRLGSKQESPFKICQT